MRSPATTPFSSRHETDGRFTLIELLVVIGIISLLASMLLPTLSQGRERGKRAACLEQTRQIYLATVLYADSNEDWLPPIGVGTIPNVRLFTDFLYPFLGYPDIWLCPSGDRNPARIDSGNGMVLHYGINNYDYDDVDGDGIDNHMAGLGGRQHTRVANPERVIYIADADPDSSPENIGAMQNGTTEWPLTSLAETRHTGGYNAVTLGGAAKWYPNRPNHADWAVPIRK